MKTEKVRMRAEWLAKVKQNSSFLSFIPYKLRNLELCLAAIKKNDWAIPFVPRKILNEIFAIKQKEKSNDK